MVKDLASYVQNAIGRGALTCMSIVYGGQPTVKFAGKFHEALCLC